MNNMKNDRRAESSVGRAGRNDKRVLDRFLLESDYLWKT